MAIWPTYSETFYRKCIYEFNECNKGSDSKYTYD